MKSALFQKSIEYGSNIMEQLTDDALGDPTPCSEWDVRQLINHMLYEIAWVPELLLGRTITDVGDKLDGDLVGENPLAAWEHYATLALAAVQHIEDDAVVHLSYGDSTAGQYVGEVGGDVIVHTWDLAKALGIEFHIEEKIADEVLAATERVMPMAREYNLVASQIDVSEGATSEEKLLGAFGRRLNWTA